MYTNGEKPRVDGETFRIRLTRDMKEWLFDKAHTTDRTVSDIIRDAIAKYIQSEE